jgi:antitoxin ParD1/3/4
MFWERFGLPSARLQCGMKNSYFVLEWWPKEIAMSNISKRTVSLPQEHAAYIDHLVASGAFASASEVVRAGLRALQERDEAVERWLREQVAPAFDAMKSDPARGTSVKAVFDDIRAHHAAALKGDR